MRYFGAAHFSGTRSPNLLAVPATSPARALAFLAWRFCTLLLAKVFHHLVSVRP